MIDYKSVKNDPTVRAYVTAADEALTALGYTEHSFAHVEAVAKRAGDVLADLGYPARTVELVRIAALLHDIGNVVNRVGHSQSGALMAHRILSEMGMAAEEVTAVIMAIGNHDEGEGVPVSDMAAALILADKSDVRRSRVRGNGIGSDDIHDRVNYSVIASALSVEREAGRIVLAITLDTAISPVIDFFEIFLERMLLCKRAAGRLGMSFGLVINGETVA